MKVAVISGGRSSEHEVSVRSGASVAEGIRAAGHDVVEVRIERDGRWISQGEEVGLAAGAGLLDAAAAFPVLHGPFGEDGTVQGLLECLDLPYVGPGVLAAAVTIDKIIFKRVLASAGIAQVGFCEVGEENNWREKVKDLGLPVWVKPSRLGSSVGIAKVESLDDLDAAIAHARRFDPRVIIEAHCGGREIECSVIGNEELTTSVCGEIVTAGDWYDFESKYSDGGMKLVAPADIDEAVAGLIRERAEQIYRLTGCTGLARCDFFLDGDQVLVNELNTIPGFTDQSVFAKLFEASGIGYPELCQRLLDLALERYERERSFKY